MSSHSDQADILAAGSVPCTVATRFRLFANKGSVRIVFGEEPAPGAATAYHTSIILSAPDARSLGDLINDQLLKAESQT